MADGNENGDHLIDNDHFLSFVTLKVCFITLIHIFSNSPRFQVENRLFRIPSHILTERSKVFEDMFKVPQPVGVPVQGQCTESPINLEGISPTDFSSLLKCIYPR